MLAVSVGGLGKFIWMSQWFLEFDKVIVGLVIVGIIGLSAEQFVFKPLERATLARWGFTQDDL